MPPPRPPLPLHPYRLFHLSARLRLAPAPPDDYYAILLSTPLPDSAAKDIKPARSPKTTQPSSTPKIRPPSPASSIQGSDKRPENKVSFGRVLSGPSARVRGAEKGLGRPKEPDNCCMSGCVNCVWDAYREEVEEWAGKRRRVGFSVSEGGVGDLDGGEGGMDGGEEDLFEGVPVGIREFMLLEKRLREGRGEG